MMKNLHIKYLLLIAIFLAGAMSGYYFINGENIDVVTNVFLAGAITASPLKLYIARTIPLLRAKSKIKKLGTQLKNNQAILDLSETDTILLNKEKIITKNQPHVTEIFPEGISKALLLSQAASAVSGGKSEINKAIYKFALAHNVPLNPASAFTESNSGIEALVNRVPIRVGTAAYLNREGVRLSAELLTKADQLELHGNSAIFVANDRNPRGIIAIADEVSTTAKNALHELQGLGLQLVLITSDSKRTATAIKKQSGIDKALYELNTVTKEREIKLMQTKGANVALFTSNPNDELMLSSICPKILLANDNSSSYSKLPDIILDGEVETMPKIMRIAISASHIISLNNRLALIFYLLLVLPSIGLLSLFDLGFISPINVLIGELLAIILIIANSLRA